MEEKWEESRKDGMILQNQQNFSEWLKSGIMLVLDKGKRGKAKSTSITESRCAKDSDKAVYLADHKIYF